MHKAVGNYSKHWEFRKKGKKIPSSKILERNISGGIKNLQTRIKKSSDLGRLCTSMVSRLDFVVHCPLELLISRRFLHLFT